MTGSSKARPLGRVILSAFGTSMLGVFSGLLTNLWLIRQITKEISPAEFGVYALVLQLTAYLGTLQLGLDFAASRRIAEALGGGDERGAGSAFREVRRFNRRAAPVVGALVLVGAVILWAGPPGMGQGKARLAAGLLLVTGSSQIVTFLTRANYAALVGSQRQVLTNILTVASSFATTFLAFGLLRLGLGVYCIPIAFLMSTAVSGLIMWGVCRAQCGFVRLAVPADLTVLKRLAAFGGFSTLNGVAWSIEATSDVVLLGWLGGADTVAKYVLWWRFPSMLFDLCTRLVLAAFPGFAERYGLSPDRARVLFGKVSTVSAGLATLGMIGVAVWLVPFMNLWVGPAYSLPDGALIAALMGIVVMLRATGNLHSMFWVARGDARFTAFLGVGQAMVKVLLGTLFGWRFGIAGLLVASCCASVVQISGVATMLRRTGLRTLRLRELTPYLMALALVFVLELLPLPGQMKVASFGAGIATTAVLWGLVWLCWAWNGPLRPNLQHVFARAGLRTVERSGVGRTGEG